MHRHQGALSRQDILLDERSWPRRQRRGGGAPRGRGDSSVRETRESTHRRSPRAATKSSSVAGSRSSLTRTRASTATQPSGPTISGLRSSSATSGRSSPSAESRWRTSATASASGSRLSPVAAHERACLPFEHELLRVDIRERCDAHAGVADQLGEHATRAERDQRAEELVLDEPRQQLALPLRIGWTSTGASDPRRRLPGRRPRTGDRERRRRSRSVRSGDRGLHDDGKPSSRREAGGFVGSVRHALLDDRDSIGPESARCRRDPARGRGRVRARRDGSTCSVAVDASQCRDAAGRAAQPLRARGRPAEGASGGSGYTGVRRPRLPGGRTGSACVHHRGHDRFLRARGDLAPRRARPGRRLR